MKSRAIFENAWLHPNVNDFQKQRYIETEELAKKRAQAAEEMSKQSLHLKEEVHRSVTMYYMVGMVNDFTVQCSRKLYKANSLFTTTMTGMVVVRSEIVTFKKPFTFYNSDRQWYTDKQFYRAFIN